jgi:hypothetical protein
MKRFSFPCFILFGLASSLPVIAGPGIAYPDPPGGWTYILDGSQAAPGSASAAFDALDGTWNGVNGSSEWSRDGVGGTLSNTNPPGGVSTFTEGDLRYPGSNVTYLRIQDTGNPSQYSGASFTNNGCGGCTFANPPGSNRKIWFGHDVTAETPADTFLDDGFTITFRARVPTPAKTTNALDSLYPNGESGNGVQPYPAGGDGYLIQDNANGLIAIRQLANAKIAFSLVTSNDTLGGLNTVPKANFQGLQVNGLNGTTPNNNIDFGEAGGLQFLPLDPTDWNEFWIVVQRDNSGLGTHTILVYTNGSTSAQIFHITAAAGSTEYGGRYIALGMTQTAQMGTVDVDFLAYKYAAVFPPGAGGLPPEISNVVPLPPPQGNLFYAPANGVSFAAGSSGGKTISAAGITLVLNGVNVSGGLNVTGSGTTNVTVTYGGLGTNTVYTGLITVTDSGGQSANFPLRFDTFTEPSAVVIEAEDFNYSNGTFTDDPAPNGYSGFSATPEVDFHDVTPATLGAYRAADAVDTVLNADSVRDKFTAAGANDFDVGSVEQGEWLNYTRTFAAGKYNVYLRCAAQVAQPVQLDLVTGDRTHTNQTTASLGTFSVPNSGAVHTYVQLKDAFGANLVLNLSGVQTLRLTAPEASLNLQLNYLVLAALTASVTNPPVVGFTTPASNSTTAIPDAPIKVAIVNRDTAVATNTINFRFDGTDVTSATAITTNPGGAQIVYQPPGQLALNSFHTNRLVFTDNGTPARTFTNQWSFRVANLPVLLSAWATPPGSGLTNGFNIQIHYHEGGQDLLFPNNATRAEDQVGGLLNDAGTGLPYVNEATGCTPTGVSSESAVINYSNDATDRGSFAGDGPLPCIDPGSRHHVAMAVTAYLDLPAGLHRFGVRRNDGFKLSAGADFSRSGAGLGLGVFETPNNDNGTATTEFEFMAQSAGVYPFRLIFFQNSGSCDVEWYSVNRASGVATLINDPANPASVKAYQGRILLPLVRQQIVNPRVVGTNLTFQYPTLFGHTYYVDYKD